MVDDHVDCGPGAELALPVRDGGERGDDEKWATNAHAEDLKEECYGLYGLPQAHLVCQDTVFPVRTRKALSLDFIVCTIVGTTEDAGVVCDDDLRGFGNYVSSEYYTCAEVG